MGPEADGDRALARRTLIVALVVGLVYVAWQIATVWLLAFAAVLVGILLHGLAARVARRTPLSERAATAIVVALVALAVGVVLALFGAQMSGQFGQVVRNVSDSLERLRDMLGQSAWGRVLLDRLQGLEIDSGGVLARAREVASALVGGAGYALLVLVAGVYLAFERHMYLRGAIQLAPPRGRGRAAEGLETLGRALWSWTLGQLLAMAVVFAMVTVGLWLFGIPGALALGLFAGLAEFVPIVGPIAASVPAILIALSEDPMRGVYVALFYVGVQQVEGYLVYPLIQERVVSLPPVLALFAIVAFGILFGFLGVLLAAPLTVALMVIVKLFYVREALETPTSVPGQDR